MQIFALQKDFLKEHANSFGDGCFHGLSVPAGPNNKILLHSCRYTAEEMLA